MDTYLRTLASGTVVHVDPATDRPLGPATPIDGGCPEWFRVPSGHPEPDCEADCWTEVTCGAPMFETYRNRNGRICTNGCVYRGIEVETRIDAAVDQCSRIAGRDLDPIEAEHVRAMVPR